VPLLLPAGSLDVVSVLDLRGREILKCPGPVPQAFIDSEPWADHQKAAMAKPQGTSTLVSCECSNTPQPG
jgi:hypothetical protein